MLNRARYLRSFRLREADGFALLEVMISLVILLVGLLGLAGLLVQANRSEFESYQKKQASILLQDMADRLKSNPFAAQCYALDPVKVTATKYVGHGATFSIPASGSFTCSPANDDEHAGADVALRKERARQDLVAWDNALKGAAEVIGTDKLGAALDARGCIEWLNTFSADSGAESGSGFGAPGTYSEFRVSVAWRGTGDTAAPDAALTCATGTYGNEARRRVMSLNVRIPWLT